MLYSHSSCPILPQQISIVKKNDFQEHFKIYVHVTKFEPFLMDFYTVGVSNCVCSKKEPV